MAKQTFPEMSGKKRKSTELEAGREVKEKIKDLSPFYFLSSKVQDCAGS